MSQRITVGSHVTLTEEYMADHDVIATGFVHEVVDRNLNWGLRVVPVAATDNGSPCRDWAKSRWVDATDLRLAG